MLGMIHLQVHPTAYDTVRSEKRTCQASRASSHVCEMNQTCKQFLKLIHSLGLSTTSSPHPSQSKGIYVQQINNRKSNITSPLPAFPPFLTSSLPPQTRPYDPPLIANFPPCIWSLYSCNSAASFCSSASSAACSLRPARRCLMQQKAMMQRSRTKTPREPAMMPIFAPCGRAAQRLRTPEGDWISWRTGEGSSAPPLNYVLVQGKLGSKIGRVQRLMTYATTLTFCHAPLASMSSQLYSFALV